MPEVAGRRETSDSARDSEKKGVVEGEEQRLTRRKSSLAADRQPRELK
jgi:hypothetical protein